LGIGPSIARFRSKRIQSHPLQSVGPPPAMIEVGETGAPENTPDTLRVTVCELPEVTAAEVMS